MDSSLPPELKDAIDIATEEESQDTTNGPKIGILDDLLTESDTSDTSNDTKVPKDLGGLNNDNGPTINPGEE